MQNKPTIVRLVDRPKEPHKAIYEIDQKPDNPSAKAPETARVAEANQRVEREMAPKGQDTRDQKAQRPSKPSSFKQPMAAKKSIPSIKPRKKPLISREKNTINKLPEQPPLPPIQKLTQLTPNTLDRIEASEKVERKKIKERADLESGDTVWLNLKRGLLISFFRRFRNQIEGVWNYPVEAIEKEQQGTLLLKITVDRDGGLVDVDLLNSSGSDILDYEAIQAVYRAAPFGPLGKHYPHPDLKIMANFHYHLTGKFIYGKTR